MNEQRTELWAGWSLILPPGCQAQRNEDRSWSAWDEEHVIDVSIIETSGRLDGSTLTAEDMLAGVQGERHKIDGALVVITTDVEQTDTPDGRQAIEWTRATAGAANTSLVMSIGNAGRRDDAWHKSVWRNIAYTPPRSGFRRRFGRG